MAPSGLGWHSDCVDERRECGRYLASTRVIEEESGKRRTPILEHSRERPSLESRGNPVLEQVRDAHTGQRGVDDHALIIEDERPFHSYLYAVASFLELPLVERAC